MFDQIPLDMGNLNGTTDLASQLSWVTQYGPFYNSLIAIIILLVVTFVVRFVKYRLEFKKLNGSLKALPFNFLLGTLPALVPIFAETPRDAHPTTVISLLYRKLKLGGLYFMDNWPATLYRQMVIVDPGLAAQVTQSHVLPKHPIIRDLLIYITGPTSMLYTEGAIWKRARTLFNPGFAVSHLMTLVPGIVEDGLNFHKVLSEYADSGELLQIETKARLLAIDVMSRVVLDHSLQSLLSENELAMTFLNAVTISPDINNPYALSHLNPILHFKRLYYERKMNNYLEKVLDDRFKARNTFEGGAIPGKKGRKPVIDLALDEYVAQQKEEGNFGKASQSDKKFKSFAIDQMKTFLLAGHDTTSSALAYTYYLLAHHPVALEKLRKEFRDIFGTDSIVTSSQICKEPHLVNKLDFTTACIKESLRLYPPASAIRKGDNTSIVYNGISYSTGNEMVWIQTHSLHRRPDLFPSPDEFIPERFLPAPDNFQEIPKDAYRPFEKGPRACLGQELAMLEIKIVLALTLREFDIEDGYEEWDRKLGRENPGDTLNGKRGMFGYRSYQILEATAKPVDFMPVKVKRRKA